MYSKSFFTLTAWTRIGGERWHWNQFLSASHPRVLLHGRQDGTERRLVITRCSRMNGHIEIRIINALGRVGHLFTFRTVNATGCKVLRLLMSYCSCLCRGRFETVGVVKRTVTISFDHVGVIRMHLTVRIGRRYRRYRISRCTVVHSLVQRINGRQHHIRRCELKF